MPHTKVRERANRRDELTKVMSMRISANDRDLLERVGTMIASVPKLTLARVAMRLGLEALEANPALVLEKKR